MADLDLDALNEEIDDLEAAFNAVFVEGLSYRQAAKRLGVQLPSTVRNRAMRYRELLKRLRFEDTKDDFIVEYEAQLQRALQQADEAIERTSAKGQVLAMVGAINSKSTILDKIMKVRGLEAPKEDKTNVDARIEIVWGNEDSE